MDRLLNSGTDRPLKDYLDAIANDDKFADRLKPYRWLARRLRALVDSKLKVHLMNDADEGFAGAYYGRTRGSEPVIHLNDAFDAGSRVSTLVHEAMHSVTANYIDHIAGDKPVVGNWDNV